MLEKLRDNFGFKGCSVPNQHLCMYIYVYGGFRILLQNPKAALCAATAPARAFMRTLGLGFRV